jgi:hypothetical protein
MYGIEPGNKFPTVIGKEICQIGIGMYDVQLNWGNGGVHITGRFRYVNRNTGQECHWTEGNAQAAAATIALLQQTFVEPKAGLNEVTFFFSNGDELTVYDNLQYEVLQILNGNDPTIII